MVIEEALVAHLAADPEVAALVGTRIFPGVIPQDAALPAVAYQKISGPRVAAHDGATGLAFPRFQLTCTAETYGAAKGVINEMRKALDGYRGLMAGGVQVEGCFVKNEMDGYNQTGRAQTVRLDILILHKE